MALLVVTLTWALVRIAPGNFYSGEKKLPAAVEANIRAKYGLDLPWYQQYWMMISNVARGDFGASLRYEGQTVNEIIGRHLPYSATLGLLAYVIALLVGLAAGTFAALKQNSGFDYGSMSAAMLGLSIPNFVLGPLLVLVFSFWLYWLPPARWGGPSALVLPVLTLAAIYAAYIARLARAGMLEVMRSDYIRTARAKGLSERTILFRHALRGGMIPVVSFTGPALAALLAGTVVVERVFAIPGLGNIFIQSVLNRDEPLILGIVAFLSILIMIFNLAVDISYGFLDPRIRYT
jgi:oligopeptide transport system permease protein